MLQVRKGILPYLLENESFVVTFIWAICCNVVIRMEIVTLRMVAISHRVLFIVAKTKDIVFTLDA